MTALVVVQTIVTVLLVVLVVGLLRSHAVILRALHDLGVNLEDGHGSTSAEFSLGTRGQAARTRAAEQGVVPAGSPLDDRIGESDLALPADGPLGDAHDLMGTNPSGDGIAISVRSHPGLTLIAFLTSGCQSCMDFWSAFEDEAARQIAGPRSRLVVITRGLDAESPAAVAELAHDDLEVLMSSEAFDDYSVPIAPYFVLIDDGRVIGEGASASFDQLGSLMSKALRDAGYGMGGRRSRRALLRGGRQTADEALAAAGIGPGHPSLHDDPVAGRDGIASGRDGIASGRDGIASGEPDGTGGDR